jgi:NADH:ubiquinone oxidoreductase subunit F (NADH-binding)
MAISDRDSTQSKLDQLQELRDEAAHAGTEKAVKLMAQGPWDEKLLTELSAAMRDASICGLGQAAPNPLLCVLKYFPDELKKPLGTW